MTKRRFSTPTGEIIRDLTMDEEAEEKTRLLGDPVFKAFITALEKKFPVALAKFRDAVLAEIKLTDQG